LGFEQTNPQPADLVVKSSKVIQMTVVAFLFGIILTSIILHSGPIRFEHDPTRGGWVSTRSGESLMQLLKAEMEVVYGPDLPWMSDHN